MPKPRLLSHLIHRHLLDPASLPPLLRTLRGALFPNNMPGKPTLVAPSSNAELLALRRRCARSLWELVPGWAGRRYFGGGGRGLRTDPAAGGDSLGRREKALTGGGKGRKVEGETRCDDEEDRILSEIETGILDVFGDAYCNKHLMYSVLELFLVRLMPELAEKGVAELWEERLSFG